MKLFIDDNREAPEGWHLARTITEAIRVIASQDIKEISIDHDIENYEQENFTAVAYFIGAWYGLDEFDEHPKITVHSGNPVGAERIKQILEGADIESTYQPYSKI